MSTSYLIFASVTPGLEPALAEELRWLWPDAGKLAQRRGGVELRAPREGLWRLARWTRLAESLRIRIGSFEARSFAALRKGLGRLPWAAYLTAGAHPSIRVTCRKSALYHSDAVKGVVRSKLSGTLGDGQADHEAPEVFVRIVKDRAQVSVGSSGEPLHRRGYRQHIGDAPLRETLAAALLWHTEAGEPAPLWDPFCGSGTVVIEALGLAGGLPAPVGRGFAFERWATHSEDDYAAWLAADEPPEPRRLELTDAIGSDADPMAIMAAEANLTAAGLSGQARFGAGDFEDAAAAVPEGARIVTNLPYGHRLDASQLTDTFRRFGALLKRREDLAEVLVLNGHRGFEQATGLRWDTLLELRNRGLRVRMLRLTRGGSSEVQVRL